MKICGEFNFLGEGQYFIALDMPDKEFVIKFPKPLHPLYPLIFQKKGLKKWWSAHQRRAKYVKKAATANQIFRMLLQSKSIDVDKCFPPTVILDEVDVVFEWEGRSNRYKGSAYLQRRVEVFDNPTPLDSFNWDAIIEIQHQLWRVGIGLGSSAEVWGPKNWSRAQNGEIRLADLSSLTQNKNRVNYLLDSTVVQTRRHRLEQCQPIRCQGKIDSYLVYMGKFLNKESLNKLWNAGF